MRIHRIMIWTMAFAVAGLGVVMGGREMLLASVTGPKHPDIGLAAARAALALLYVAEWPPCLAWTCRLAGMFNPISPVAMAVGVAGWALVGFLLGLLAGVHGRGVKALLPPKFFAIVFAALPVWIFLAHGFMGDRAVPDLSIFVAVNVAVVLVLLLYTLLDALLRRHRLPPEKRLPIRF